ncbi:MAG: DUF4886 domain-containing protein [Lentisphaeria bacterium]|nr:DUF4886 domain-containing protein [Lentisphaeria bacterium]
MNILTIGNSFTWSLQQYFPAVVNAGGEKLNLKFMNFGGCELKRHWTYIESETVYPGIGFYQGARMDKTLAEGADWDIVTIQQASHMSWRPESFEPYAGKIVEYVRKYAPKAEIVVQQTWAYRADHPKFAPGSEWGISQDEMYRRLTQNYKDLAARYGLRMIPTGYAVQLTRENDAVKFRPYDPELLNKLTWPDLPPQAGDPVGNISWAKNAEGELFLQKDLIHLNVRGKYLQSCLWFAFLYGKSPEITAQYFLPEEIGNTDAAFLRAMAEKAARTPFDEIC